jgi:hypothetical protein
LVPLSVSLPEVPVIVQPSELLIVVLSASLSLPLFGSLWEAETLALAVTVPVAFGSIVIVIVALALLASVPSEQDTVGALIEQEPCEDVADRMVAEAPDSVVDALTEVAVAEPLLVTVTT